MDMLSCNNQSHKTNAIIKIKSTLAPIVFIDGGLLHGNVIMMK